MCPVWDPARVVGEEGCAIRFQTVGQPIAAPTGSHAISAGVAPDKLAQLQKDHTTRMKPRICSASPAATHSIRQWPEKGAWSVLARTRTPQTRIEA
jgi:hypothetical protein